MKSPYLFFHPPTQEIQAVKPGANALDACLPDRQGSSEVPPLSLPTGRQGRSEVRISFRFGGFRRKVRYRGCKAAGLHILITFALALTTAPCHGTASEGGVVASRVDLISERLRKGDRPSDIFKLPFNTSKPGYIVVEWLNPAEWFTREELPNAGEYVGFLVYVEIPAPFNRVYQVLTAFRDERKFTPGIITTDVLEHKRINNQHFEVIIEKKRKLPLYLSGIKNAGYHVQKRIEMSGGDFALIRARLINDPKRKAAKKGTLMKVMEGFEYLKKIDDHKTFYIGGAFVLPNTGTLPAKRSRNGDSKASSHHNPLAASFGKFALAIDVGAQLYGKIVRSTMEGAFETTVALVQLSANEPWRNKWPYELTDADTDVLFRENEELLKQAKTNGQIKFPIL